jgi:hypothetical protein
MLRGLLVGFGYPVRGREQKAIGVFNELVGLCSRLQQEGEIDASSPDFLEAYGEDLADSSSFAATASASVAFA